LTGKVALVTGAKYFHILKLLVQKLIASSSSDGIGYHTAHQMALKGAKVYIGARNETKALEAIEEMKRESPSIAADQLHPFAADFGDLRAVKYAAQKFIENESRLDILVNNAGL
jgi:NAD(P)-dependent dehydrogenase (short-subunit alcohol dehydrogenase family)